MVPPVRPILDRAPSTCAWCATPLNGTPAGRSGRMICAACGVATTTPWPTDAELDGPTAGPTGRAWAASPGRATPSSAASAVGSPGGWTGSRRPARARRRRGRRRAASIALRTVAGTPPAWSARRRGATSVRETSARSTGSGRRSSSGTRSSTSATPGAALRPRRPPAGAARRARGRRCPTPTASRRGRSATAGWRSTCPATSCTCRRAPCCDRLRAAGLRVERVSHLRGGQVRLRLAARAGRRAARDGRDLYDAIRRPQARSRPMAPARPRGRRSPPRALAFPLAAAGTALEVVARRGGSIYVEARRG